MLEPDRDQIEIFVDAVLRHVGDKGFFSLRSFYEYEENEPKAFRITPVRLNGNFKFLVDTAVHDARRAAQHPKRVVFCPPLTVLKNGKTARQEDIALGLVLSVECDKQPQEARIKLEAIFGPATVVVRSGGIWKDPAGGEYDKLHLHWQLATPASGEAVPRLKRARDIASRLVGADTTNTPIVHPIRWPGSWHRKKEPRLCVIQTVSPDIEIDLDEKLAALVAAAPAEPPPRGNGPDTGGGPRLDWLTAFGKLLAGEDYHPVLTPLASSFAARRIPEAEAYEILTTLMALSRPSDPMREQRRITELAKLRGTVSSGYAKYARRPEDAVTDPKPNGGYHSTEVLKTMLFEPIKYVVPGVVVEGLTILAGKPKAGKSWLMLHAAVAVARGEFTLGEIRCPEGDVLYCALEDNQRRLQSRLTKLCGITRPWPKRMSYYCLGEMPRLNAGGLDMIRKWIEDMPHPRLVVIDTFVTVRAPKKGNEPSYDADYESGKELQKLANEHNVAIVIVHHLRKLDADDVFDTISGTLGLTGVVDTVLVLKRETTGGTTLFGRGRDLAEVEKALIFNKDACTWMIAGDAATVQQSGQRAAILDALAAAAEPLSPTAIARAAGMKPANVYFLLRKMLDDGVLVRTKYGRYEPARLSG